jgi:hypothetical protein
MSILLWKNAVGGSAAVTVLKARPMIEMQGSGGIWIDITSHWRADTPIILTYGIQGSDPTDRVASTGSLEWQMDNGARLGSTLAEASVVSQTRFHPYWQLNVPIRFSVGQLVGPRQIKFQGTLASALPSPDGKHGERRVFCTALDWWDEMARMAIPDHPTEYGLTSGQLFNRLLLDLPLNKRPPGSESLEAGLETFAVAFDGGVGQQISVRERANDIAMSELGYAYIRGGSASTQFVFEQRTHRLTTPVLFSLTDTEITGMAAIGSRDDLFGTVRVRVHPTVLGTDSATVLYALETATPLVQIGETLTTLFGPYRDPVSNELVGATNQLPPVATVDYTMNAAADGSGADLTAFFTVSASFTGVGVRFTVSNLGGQDGYITKFQVRGQPIYRTETLVEKPVTGGYGIKTLDLDMPYQNNINTALSIAQNFASIYGQPAAQIQAVRFCATRTDALFEAARLREPGDRIQVTETMSGMTAQPFHINSVQLEITQDAMWCTWGLEQASAQAVWIMDQSVIQNDATGTTRLGF